MKMKTKTTFAIVTTFLCLCGLTLFIIAKDAYSSPSSTVPIAPSVFELRHVVIFPDDAIQCAKDKGRAASVADIDEDGYITSPWVSFCILEVKR